LLDLKVERGHYALIAGRTLKDGRISLCAGAAHGVRLKAIYGIYPSNIKAHLKKLGELYVEALNNDDVTATLLCKDSNSFTVPPFFYAAEERGYSDPAKIFVPEVPEVLKSLSGWAPASESEANITLEVDENKILFMWNGLTDDPKCQRESKDNSLSDRSKIRREIRRAARFHYHLVAPSPDNSSVFRRLRVQFKEVDTSTDTPTGENLLNHDSFLGSGFVTLESKMGKTLGPYSLTIFNDNTFPVWPYVFICDPEGFTISAYTFLNG
jgi:hypothetical protein